jgi:hypothetical protein
LRAQGRVRQEKKDFTPRRAWSAQRKDKEFVVFFSPRFVVFLSEKGKPVITWMSSYEIFYMRRQPRVSLVFGVHGRPKRNNPANVPAKKS